MVRTAIVTGANTGIGFHTALQLASTHGFHVLLACRSVSRGEAAAAAIRAQNSEAVVTPMELDLCSFASVVAFAGRVRDEIGAIHVLVLNGGIGGMGIVAQPTEDGCDLLYRVNFVSHFLLTLLLEPCLAAGAGGEADTPARVVCVSSVTHRFGDAADWHAPLGFVAGRSTYSTSKLAMAVLAAEVTRRWGTRRAARVVGLAVNPGAVNSDIWYRGQLPRWLETCAVRPLFSRLFLTAAQGAACSVAAASHAAYAPPGAVPPGLYLSPYRSPRRLPMPFDLWGPFAGAQRCTPHPPVTDAAAGAALWEATRGALRAWLPLDTAPPACAE